MKPFLLGFLPAGFLFLAASPLFGQANTPLAMPHFELYQPYEDMKRPTGVLGLPLGTFAVIEGTEHHTSMSWGGADFVVEKINGKKVDHELRIITDWPSQLPDKRVPGKRYVLHGYEGGSWEGSPYGQTQMVGFLFFPSFTVTSVEKVDGVTVADARPLDPKIPLAEPIFATMPDPTHPIGLLGLPLGTYAIIQVQSPKHGALMVSPFEVDKVNGERMKSPRLISIPGFTLPKDAEQATLQGFETGRWENTPDLPDSEYPTPFTTTRGMQQTNFGFQTRFIVKSVAQPATQ